MERRNAEPTAEMPSRNDIDQHREDHCPYQSWCDACVAGSGRESAHRQANFSARAVPTVAFDYLFVNDRGVFTRIDFEAETDKN